MIRIGTSGFSFADWLGTVYPPNLKARDMLPYYEQVLGLDCTELNYTYYTMPSPRTMDGLLEKTSNSFQFLVRSHADMTHNIWIDEERRELKDNQDVFLKFRAGIDPLVRAGRLGCVLLQFPVFFLPRRSHLEYLVRCRTWLADVPLSVEFRNSAWNREETYSFLAQHDLGTCIVDEPKLPRLMPFVPRLTSAVGYFRLHGRNANWFGADKARRYDYLYPESELREIVPELRRIEEQSRVTYVAFNNCHAGSAARNALMTKQFLGLLTPGDLSPEQNQVLGGKVPLRGLR